MTNEELDSLSYKIIGAAVEVHRELGPGLLEYAYRRALLLELHLRGLKAQTEVTLPILYKNTVIENAYRADIIVEDTIILEIKSVAQYNPLFAKQLKTYLRFANKPVGLVLNFNMSTLQEGLTRVTID